MTKSTANSAAGSADKENGGESSSTVHSSKMMATSSSSPSAVAPAATSNLSTTTTTTNNNKDGETTTSSSDTSQQRPKAIHDNVVMDCRRIVSAGWNQGMRQFWSQLIPTYYYSSPWAFFWNNNNNAQGSNSNNNNNSSSLDAYARERDRLEDFWILPLTRGLTVTLMTFVTFRVVASRSFQNWQRLYIQNVMEPLVEQPSSSTTAATNATTNTTKKQWKSYVERVQEGELDKRATPFQSGKKSSSSDAWWVSWYPSGSAWMDAILSLALGTSTALFSYDSTQFYTNLCQAPLLPGKSLIYQTACPAILSCLKDLQQQHPNMDIRHNPRVVLQLQHQAKQATGDAVTFWATHVMAHNCTLREVYLRQRHERKLKQQQQQRFGDDNSSFKEHGNSTMDTFVPYPGIKGRDWPNVPK